MIVRIHGGRTPPGITLDFSTPINPLGAPEAIHKLVEEAVKLRIYTKYPDYEYQELRQAIASFYSIDEDRVIPLNGAAEGISLAITCLKPDVLVVFEPTFGDYRQEAHALGIPIISISYIERVDECELNIYGAEELGKVIRNRKALVLLSNPNNPTGCYSELRLLKHLAEILENSVILIDEAFVELCNECESALSLAKDYENAAVLRSLTKTFSVPGLRIGFLYLSNEKVHEVLEACRQPWNINSLTSFVFSKALTEHASQLRKFVEDSRRVIAEERSFLVKSFRELGIKVHRSRAPFILVRHKRFTSRQVNEALTRFGIVVRDASTFTYLTPYHARVSVRLREDNQRLIEAYKVLGIE
ncbi:MAG: histidinol-phosphate aminotransferase family protein [Ignisphaera sp.]|nr:histidinol-phosphate aminotransferase family protein [Ignisphaera sp.]